MNEAALERMGERDDAIFDRVGEDRSSAVSIEEIVRCGLRVGTVRSSLKRLMEQGLVERVWRGNQRFGRYLYFLKYKVGEVCELESGTFSIRYGISFVGSYKSRAEAEAFRAKKNAAA
jgi:hypothetical protein